LSFSLILPTLDERENVERFVPELLSTVAELTEIIVVDDSSTDGTPEVVERLAAQDGRVRLIQRRGEPNLTDSIQQGVAAARGDLVGWMDADLVMRLEDLSALVREVRSGADVAVASRFASGGKIKGQERDGLAGRVQAIFNLRTTEDPWLGVLLSWTLNSVVLPALVGAGYRDYTSGIIVARRSVLGSIRLRGHHGEYFIHLWADLISRGATVVEVPYPVQPRRYGRSKTGNDVADYVARGRRYLAAGVAAGRSLRAARRVPGDSG
jgi:dolichol-phosphate mannosyltransferase